MRNQKKPRFKTRTILLPTLLNTLTTTLSRMRMKVLAMLGLAAICLILTGCSAIQGYSVRSYQGPLPMGDYQYLNGEAYGSALSTRH